MQCRNMFKYASSYAACICMCINVGSNYRFVIVVPIFGIHMYHKQQYYSRQVHNFIATSNPASSTDHICSELSSLGQRSLITTLKF